jgi:hypothetical protein
VNLVAKINSALFHQKNAVLFDKGSVAIATKGPEKALMKGFAGLLT